VQKLFLWNLLLTARFHWFWAFIQLIITRINLILKLWWIAHFCLMIVWFRILLHHKGCVECLLDILLRMPRLIWLIIHKLRYNVLNITHVSIVLFGLGVWDTILILLILLILHLFKLLNHILLVLELHWVDLLVNLWT